MKPRRNIEDRTGIPPAVVKLCERRTAGMLHHFGRNLDSQPPITLQTLVQSCYLQGVEDAMVAAVPRETLYPTH